MPLRDCPTPEEYRRSELTSFISYRDISQENIPTGGAIGINVDNSILRYRNTFFSTVYTQINDLITHGLLPDDFGEFADYMERDRDWHERATDHDITLINTVITRVISLLEAPPVSETPLT